MQTKTQFCAGARRTLNVAYLNKSSNGAERIRTVLNSVMQYYRYNSAEVTYSVYTAAYGLLWGFDTNRLNHESEKALLALSVQELLKTVYALSLEHIDMGSVVRAWNARYAA